MITSVSFRSRTLPVESGDVRSRLKIQSALRITHRAVNKAVRGAVNIKQGIDHYAFGSSSFDGVFSAAAFTMTTPSFGVGPTFKPDTTFAGFRAHRLACARPGRLEGPKR